MIQPVLMAGASRKSFGKHLGSTGAGRSLKRASRRLMGGAGHSIGGPRLPRYSPTHGCPRCPPPSKPARRALELVVASADGWQEAAEAQAAISMFPREGSVQ
jgi:hypothetical protein